MAYVPAAWLASFAPMSANECEPTTTYDPGVAPAWIVPTVGVEPSPQLIVAVYCPLRFWLMPNGNVNVATGPV